jgi:hypothetical protein
MERQQVETWLTELGCRFRAVNSPGVAWHLTDVMYPPDTTHVVHILSPMPRQPVTNLSSDTTIGGPMLRELQALPADRQAQAVTDFRQAIARPGMTTQPRLMLPHLVPAGFLNFIYVNDNELTSAQVLRAKMATLFEAHRAGIESLGRYLPPMPPPPNAMQ